MNGCMRSATSSSADFNACVTRLTQARVVGEGVLFEVLFTDTDITDYRSTLRADAARLRRFKYLLRARGIFRGDSKFYLSIVHDQRDVDETLVAFASAVWALRE